jgi:hypothetical protein
MAAMTVRTGLADRVFKDRLRITPSLCSPPESVETVLQEVMGQPVRVSLGLGNRRANQKPILQVMGPTGLPLAFVKVGNTAVTRALVRAEAESLDKLASLTLSTIRVPRVIGLRAWRDMELLVLSALHTGPRRRHRPGHLPVSAFLELASAPGLYRAPLQSSAYWKSLRTRVDAVADPVAGPRLRARVAGIAERYGDAVVEYGAWHGDWTPWNMSWERSGLALWDWERFAVDVPLGFDPLHYSLRVWMMRFGGTVPAGEALRAASPQLLAPFGIGPDLASVVLSLYLLELSVRYTDAAASAAGAPLKELAEWLLGFATRPDLIV